MPGIDVNQLVTVSRALPTPQIDQKAGVTNPRAGRYLEQYVMSMFQTDHLFTDEGSFFVGTNPTAGTGLAFTAATQTTFSDTAGVGLILRNNDAASSTKRIYVRYLKLVATVASAANTIFRLHFKIDNIPRFSSGGTAITPVNLSMDAGVPSTVAQLTFGNVTALAASAAARVIGTVNVRTIAIPIGDVIMINFGPIEMASSAANLAVATALGQVFPGPPVVLGSGQSFLVHPWGTSMTTAPTFEFEMGWIER